MNTILTTGRLLLRRFRAGDAQDLHIYLSDPETVRYEPYEPFSPTQAEQEAARRASDDAFWAVCLPDSGKVIGNIYFARQQPEQFCTWELGYVFSRAFTGQGYATEAAACVLRYGFEACAAHRVEAHCNPENSRSWRLLERLGLRREGHLLQNVYFRCDEQGTPLWQDTYTYALLRSEWRGC